jgi:hypothetical protein
MTNAKKEDISVGKCSDRAIAKRKEQRSKRMESRLAGINTIQKFRLPCAMDGCCRNMPCYAPTKGDSDKGIPPYRYPTDQELAKRDVGCASNSCNNWWVICGLFAAGYAIVVAFFLINFYAMQGTDNNDGWLTFSEVCVFIYWTAISITVYLGGQEKAAAKKQAAEEKARQQEADAKNKAAALAAKQGKATDASDVDVQVKEDAI